MIKNILISFLLIALVGCAGDNIFLPVGDDVVNPLTIEIDSTNGFAYLNVSNNKAARNWDEGSVQVLSLADPTNPVRVQTVATASMSGDMYLDPINGYLYATNRLSESDEDAADALYRFTVNTAIGNISATDIYTIGLDPYGVSCCDASNNLYIATYSDELQYFNIGAAPVFTDLSLLRTLSDDSTIGHGEVNYMTIMGSWLFVSRIRGGVYIINLDEISDTSKNPIDYFIEDIEVPRDIANDGTYVYVVDATGGEESVFVINPASLTQLSDNTTTTILDKDDNGLLVSTIVVGEEPYRLLIGNNTIFVSNMESDTIPLIDRISLTVTTNVTVGEEPFGMDLYSPGGVDAYLYVCNITSNTVSIIDLASNTVVADYP